MPSKALRFCNHPGCNKLGGEAYCPEHQKQRKQITYQQRDNKWLYLYKDQRWCGIHGLRNQQLIREPLCAECKREKQLTVATVVDHIQRHSGDPALFYDPDNLQSLCEHHHSMKTLQEGAFGRSGRG